MAGREVKLVCVGDVFVQRPDPDSAFVPLKPLMRDAQVGFCNLETVVADAKYLDPSDKDPRPRTDEWILPAYTRAGFNIMNIANNPVLYHGMGCFMRSLDVLDEAGIVYGGGGRNLAEARRPAIIERDGTRLAFVCRTSVGRVNGGATPDSPGVARFRIRTDYERWERTDEVPGSPLIVHTTAESEDQDALSEDIRTARSQADVVIVSWHWGVSPASGSYGDVVAYQRDMGRFAIDNGADMVLGHHPHVLQPIEIYKGKPIVYSLGNYIHDMGSMRDHKFSTMLLEVVVRDGQLAGVWFVPGLIEGNGPPEFFRPADAPEVVRYVRELSEPWGTRFEVQADRVEVLLEAAAPVPFAHSRGPVPLDALHWRRAAGAI
jgi:poly-gamma-glutamate synthesis protein (capsule biosynthesis protein)